MIKSMTGYGRCQSTVAGLDIQVEIRSVNHRYYECGTRTPRAYGFLDEKLKSYLQTRIARGKVDVSVFVEAVDTPDMKVEINRAAAEATIKALQELRDAYGLRDDISVMSVARQPDVLTVRTAALDEETVWDAVRTVTDEALAQFVQMRETEGEKLRADVLSRADTILQAVAVVEEKNPQTVQAHMDKVTARIRELIDGATVDEGRLLTEAAIFADKIAVAEETVRLRSHIDQLRTMLASDEAVGRKLDFLVQEMNREANTIGSKAQDMELARTVVDIKAEIEKIREQIQNIE